MKYIWLITFLVLPLIGSSYAAWRIWHVLPFANGWRWAATALFGALFCSMFIGFSGAIEKMPLDTATVMYEVGNSFIFILLYLVMIFLALDLGRLLHLVPKAWLVSNGYTSLGILAVMFLVFVYGKIHYTNKVREQIDIKTNKEVALKGKSAAKIVLLSDLHLGYHNRCSEFMRWVDMINAEQPDLVLIAGDIIDISVRPLLEERVAEEFHRLKAPVYACLGNHEYYSGEPLAQQFYRKAGITLLRDSVAKIGNIAVIGRDDRTNAHRHSLREIMKQAKLTTDGNRGTKEITILLDHQPYHLEEAEHNGIDFQFSGHTHHGQVWPASWITDALYEKAYGGLKKGNTQYYVSSGMGIWGGKFRIGTQSEYVVLTVSR